MHKSELGRQLIINQYTSTQFSATSEYTYTCMKFEIYNYHSFDQVTHLKQIEIYVNSRSIKTPGS